MLLAAMFLDVEKKTKMLTSCPKEMQFMIHNNHFITKFWKCYTEVMWISLIAVLRRKNKQKETWSNGSVAI